MACVFLSESQSLLQTIPVSLGRLSFDALTRFNDTTKLYIQVNIDSVACAPWLNAFDTGYG